MAPQVQTLIFFSLPYRHPSLLHLSTFTPQTASYDWKRTKLFFLEMTILICIYQRHLLIGSLRGNKSENDCSFSWEFWKNKCLLWISMQTNGNDTTSVWNNFLREPSKSVGIHGDENVTFLSSVARKFKSKLNWKWCHKCAKYFFERTKFFSARIDGNEMIVLLTELENEHNISMSNWLS